MAGIQTTDVTRSIEVDPLGQNTAMRPSEMTSHDYVFDRTLMKRIKAIDPALRVVWRPFGQWRVGQPLGCWGVELRGRSGRYKPLFNWPPQYHSGLVRHIEETHGRRLYWFRNNPRGRLEDCERWLAEQYARPEREFNDWWDKQDHGKFRHAMRNLESEMLNDGFSHRAHFPVHSPRPAGASN